MKVKYTGKVAATVIKHPEKDRYLVAKRTDGHGWEFPGGKHEKGETINETAEREIQEELKIKVTAKKAAENHSYRSKEWEIIPVYAETEIREINEITLTEHSEIKWIKPENLDSSEIDLDDEKSCLEAFNLDEK